jgi:hypothetical protein
MKVGWPKCCTGRTAVGRAFPGNPRGRPPLFGLPCLHTVYTESQTLHIFAVAPVATRKLPAAAGIPVPGTSAPLPEQRGATPHLFRRVGWTARRQILSLEGSLTGATLSGPAAAGISVAGASAPIPTRRGPNPTHVRRVG